MSFAESALKRSSGARVLESFVFTQFSGEPQCFLTEGQLDAELRRVGFVRDPGVPFNEYNVLKPGTLSVGHAPAIYETAFRRETCEC